MAGTALKTNVFDHCIVVDGARRIIPGSSEQNTLHLSVDALIEYGDGNREKLVVAEMRLFFPA